MLKYLIAALTLILTQAAFADEFMSIRNIQPEASGQGGTWQPGELIVLPGGAVTLIEEELPSGELRTSDGVIITQQGKVKDTNKEIKSFRQDDLKIGAKVKLPEGKEDIISERQPDGTFKTRGGLLLTQDGKARLQISHVETFEEAEKFLSKTATPRQKEEIAARPDIDPIAELLTFNEPEMLKKEESLASPDIDPVAEILTFSEAVKEEKAETPKKQPKPVFTAKKGDKLMIPPGAAARKDFSFLKGCWKSKSLTYFNGNNTYTAPAELCFSGGNGGSFLSHIASAGGCGAKTTAKFNAGVLLIQAGVGSCKNGENTMPRVFQCEGQGSRTECYILATNGVGGVFKSQARFYKK